MPEQVSWEAGWQGVHRVLMKRRLKELYALDQASLSQEQITERNNIENWLYQEDHQRHPPVKTPPNFIERDEEW